MFKLQTLRALGFTLAFAMMTPAVAAPSKASLPEISKDFSAKWKYCKVGICTKKIRVKGTTTLTDWTVEKGKVSVVMQMSLTKPYKKNKKLTVTFDALKKEVCAAEGKMAKGVKGKLCIRFKEHSVDLKKQEVTYRFIVRGKHKISVGKLKVDSKWHTYHDSKKQTKSLAPKKK